SSNRVLSSVCSDKGAPFQQQVDGGRCPGLAGLGRDAAPVQVVSNGLQGAAAHPCRLNLGHDLCLLLDLDEPALDGLKSVGCLVGVLLAGALLVLQSIGSALGNQVALKLSQYSHH